MGKNMRVSQLAYQKGVAIENNIPPDLLVFVDPALFGEALFNILSNAVKFTRRGDRITMSSDDRWTVRVTDTGVGIRPQ